MDLINILLWTFSLTLATIGIFFGVIASINSRKANIKMQDLISTTFVTEESQKFLYDHLKKVIMFNRKAIKNIKKGITYSEYALLSFNTRFNPLSKATINLLNQTEFKDIIKMYLDIKIALDNKFISIVDTSLLLTNKVIPVKIHNQLKDYHKEVINFATTIIKNYTLTISGATENVLKK